MLDQDSGDDDDNNTIRLRYLYRGEHKRDGRPYTKEAAMAKLNASECATHCAHQAM